VRVEASRSPVIDFADDTVLAPGDTLFAVDPTQVTDLTIDAGRTLPVSGKNDYVESSEKLSRRLFVSGGAPVAGTALVNEQGSAVAIYLSDGQAVPASFISTVLKSIFVNGTALRPRAGMHYVSTDLIFGVTAPGFPRSGALLTPSNKNRAVEHLSAAESAGLQDGDVILAVERDKVNADATLAELLNEYAPGARVELTVLRAGKEEKISLTLK
jgi:S1-C subfamily serine protease